VKSRNRIISGDKRTFEICW